MDLEVPRLYSVSMSAKLVLCSRVFQDHAIRTLDTGTRNKINGLKHHHAILGEPSSVPELLQVLLQLKVVQPSPVASFRADGRHQPPQVVVL